MREATQKTALILFLIRFVKLIISVATLSVAAQYFGVGLSRESWLLTFNFVVILNLALMGPLNEVFRAKFIFLKGEEGEDIALRRTSSLFVFSLLLMLFVVVVFQFLAWPVARIIAPTYSNEELKLVVSLLHCLLWSAVISQATQLLSSILNTYNSFYVPEISGFFSAILNFAIIVVLSKEYGIFSFVIANYVSGILLLIALIYQARKIRIGLFKSKISLSWKELSPFILFSLPFFLPYIAGQLNGLLDKSLGNLIGNGAVSIIDYAKKISEIIQSVLSSVLVTIMVPAISAHFAKGDAEMVKEETKKYLQLILLILAFLIPLIMVSADAITHILYDRGRIATTDLSNISFLMKAYSIGLLAVFMYIIFGLTLLSTKKNKTYAFYGMAAQFLMMAINIFAYRYWGIFTFTISLTASHLLVAVILYFKLPINGKAAIGIKIVQYCAYGLALTIVAICINHYLYSPDNAYLHIIYNVVVLVVSGILLAKIFRITELNQITAMVSNLKRK